MRQQQIQSLRQIDLKQILNFCGCSPHPLDKSKWHTSCGIISVNGQKFMNWSKNKGGGGAIDLVCHLRGDDFKQAVMWLASNFEPFSLPHVRYEIPSYRPRTSLQLPPRDQNKTERIIHYLSTHRRIPRKIVINLIQYGNLYADSRSNAVFLLLGKEKRVVGAELRGTGSTQWRGMAPGSKKQSGCFYALGQSNSKMVLCESAIDAISCLVLWPEYTAVSTSGANHNPAWLKNFLDHGCDIYCGFDADKTGDMLADKMIRLYPSVKRLRPPGHDWNQLLQTSSPS
ncbi:MAG: DUF3991 and TOPRIM domain-containing protein [Desulfamplus sp.]|nr:DUF3991 and TOPRIM domain-containing protein [Desulfamplus sp.]